MTADDIIQHFGAGSVRKTSKLTGVSPQLLRYWRKEGVPLKHQARFEAETGGALKVAYHQPKQ